MEGSGLRWRGSIASGGERSVSRGGERSLVEGSDRLWRRAVSVGWERL